MQTIQAYSATVTALSFSSDGGLLASAGPNGSSVFLWNPATRRRFNRTEGGAVFPRDERPRSRTRAVSAVCFAPKGPALAAVFTDRLGLWPDGIHSNAIRPLGRARELAFRPDGTELDCTERTISGIEVLRLYQSDSGEPVGGLTQLPLRIVARHCLAWSPTGPLLAIAGWKQDERDACEVHVAAPGESSSHSRTFDLPGMPQRLAFSADGRTLALAVFSTIHRWDVGTGEPLSPLEGHTHIVTGLASLADGRWLSCNQDGMVRLWDNATGRCLDVLDWRLGRLFCLAVAPDGMRAAVGSEKGIILVQDLD